MMNLLARGRAYYIDWVSPRHIGAFKGPCPTLDEALREFDQLIVGTPAIALRLRGNGNLIWAESYSGHVKKYGDKPIRFKKNA
jgi:hypothetical protein